MPQAIRSKIRKPFGSTALFKYNVGRPHLEVTMYRQHLYNTIDQIEYLVGLESSSLTTKIKQDYFYT